MASTFINLPIEQVSVGTVQVSDGTDTLAVNTDGSINAVVVDGGIDEFTYNEITSVASGVSTTICTYTAIGPARLLRIMANGTNVAVYRVRVNGTTIAMKYSNFSGPLHLDFDFEGGKSLVASDVVTVTVLHTRPSSGDFNATIITRI